MYINLGSFLKIFVDVLEESESFSPPVMSDSLLFCPWEPSRLLCPWNSSGKNNGVGRPSFLQGMFPFQGWNLALPYCRPALFLRSTLIYGWYLYKFTDSRPGNKHCRTRSFTEGSTKDCCVMDTDTFNQWVERTSQAENRAWVRAPRWKVMVTSNGPYCFLACDLGWVT